MDQLLQRLATGLLRDHAPTVDGTCRACGKPSPCLGERLAREALVIAADPAAYHRSMVYG